MALIVIRGFVETVPAFSLSASWRGLLRATGEALYSVSVSLPIPFRWSAGRGAGLRGHRMGRRGHGPCHDHDARAGLLLRRTRPEEEPRLDDRPVLRDLRPREPRMGVVGLPARTRVALQRLHRQPGQFRAEQCR